ncbi:pentapeptide repeat-containing protein [Campylobacter coli]|uniref:pentapeptide repeat-containing protein n=1 Tax=Campylobacter coli TaxID=195 RepID=UPI0009316ABB|nr:pentapeptide repeat-containing protein [Campylobacter coli]
MSDFDKELAQYGIFAKSGKQGIKDNKITIIDAEIKEINFQTLQEAGIKEICISRSEIKYLYFLEKNTIKIDFRNCNFKNQILARESYFKNEVIFHQCVFDAIVDFSKAEFNSKIDFSLSVFKGEVRFIETQFSAEQSDNKTIENNFREVIFEGKTIFDNATFQARVCFALSQFKSKANFIKTEFQANQNDSNIIEKQDDNETIENDFREVIFEGKASFSNATFKARVCFALSQFKSKAIFTNTKFQANQNDSNIIEKQDDNKTIENNFREVIFEGKTIFDNATFQARVCFALSWFKDEVRFIKAQFLAKQSSNRKIIENDFMEVIFKGKVAFDSLVLKARISFLFSTFKDEALFLNINPNNCIFHNVEFNKINFIYNDDINAESNAESYVFHNAVFKDALSFKGMEFERLEFDNVLFNGVVTFSNTKFNTKPQFINCTFSNQFNIEHQYIKYSDKDIENKINNIQDKNDKFRALLNLRDLFRKLKSNRIAHHNLIDASELRTQELYTRELELKYQENKSLREKIEQWQLFFYRKLCDHHTDILQSLNSLILVIGIFVLSSVAMVVDFNYRLGYKPILEHWYFSLDFYNHHINSIIQDNYLFVVKVNFAMLFGYLILVGFALCLKYIREFFIIISYGVTLFVLVVSPKILIPAMGFFTDKRAMLDPLSTMGGIYTIVFGFVVFSFIKTIRKNSIVPS